MIDLREPERSIVVVHTYGDIIRGCERLSFALTAATLLRVHPGAQDYLYLNIPHIAEGDVLARTVVECFHKYEWKKTFQVGEQFKFSLLNGDQFAFKPALEVVVKYVGRLKSARDLPTTLLVPERSAA